MIDKKMQEIVELFPNTMKFLWKDKRWEQYCIQEIRIRLNRPAIVTTDRGEVMISKDGMIIENVEKNRLSDTYIFTQDSINILFSYLCQESIYAYLEEMKRGYITVRGGHRIGIAGEMLSLDEKELAVRRVKYINIRIAREIVGAANKILSYVYEKNHFLNTLLISPPGCGKTTLLRDLIRQVSDGNIYCTGKKIGVIDERYELEGDSYLGINLGIRTDVLSGCLKTKGIMMMLRSMSPDVIAVDEIGGEEERQALEKAAHCGCGLMATMHGESIFDEKAQYEEFAKEKLQPYLDKKLFERYIFVTRQTIPGIIQSIWDDRGRQIYERN